MKQVMNKVQNFLNDESGAAAVEYGLLAALIAGVIITAVTTIGTDLVALFNKIGSKITTATPA